jgi:hypothetical protein
MKIFCTDYLCGIHKAGLIVAALTIYPGLSAQLPAINSFIPGDTTINETVTIQEQNLSNRSFVTLPLINTPSFAVIKYNTYKV